ncbi:MAG: hypothetical protein AABY22_23710 [Nanoarchaeota archaeon]
MEAKCQKCNYQWETESPMVMVSCPSCGNKVKIREIEEINEQVAKYKKHVRKNE